MMCVILGVLLAQLSAIELPTSVSRYDWTAGPQKVITPARLFDYMNGAGELYLSYGFNRLYVREFQKPAGPTITCELYEMASSEDAYGLFSQDRTGENIKVGQGAVYSSGLLVAWQGRYFIRILSLRDNPEVKEFIIALARRVVSLCGPSGKPPEAISWLPSSFSVSSTGKGKVARLDPLSVRFFHTHNVLNYFHFIATENLLDLSPQTDAVLGTYLGGSVKSSALIIGYPTEAATRAAWDKFRRAFLKGLKPLGPNSLVGLENGRWLAGAIKGNRLAIVLDSPTREDCLALMKAIISKLGNRK